MKFVKILFFSLMVLTIGLISQTLAQEGEAIPKKIAIVPFALYAPPQYGYLKDGIYSMFVTRLFWTNKVDVLEKVAVTKAMKSLGLKGLPAQTQAQRLGQRLKVDFVLYGSITILGKEASIDTKLLDVQKKKVYPFFYQCHDPGDILSGVNNIAMSINSQILGRKISVAQTKTPPNPLVSGSPLSQPLVQGTYFRTPQNLRKWYSYPLSFAAKGLAIGDVNGDGKNEMVLIDSHTIWIYRFLDGHLNLLRKLETSPANCFVNVSLFDLDGDGKQEIIITNFPRRRLASVVYKWDDKRLVKLEDDIPWYLKVQVNPDGSKVILGQKQGDNNPFKPGIYRLQWTGRGFEPIERVCSLEKVRIFNAYFADLTSDDLKDILMLDEEDYLNLLTPTGNKEWKSTDHFYGSVFYIEGKAIDPDAINPRLERIYIPGRILVTNLDGKPPLEVIVYQNHSRVGRILRDYKDFSSGEFKILVWDGLGMKTKWKSPEIHGCITDCYLGDFDNDGQKELVFTTLRTQRTMLFNRGRTVVIAYNLKAIKIGP